MKYHKLRVITFFVISIILPTLISACSEPSEPTFLEQITGKWESVSFEGDTEGLPGQLKMFLDIDKSGEVKTLYSYTINGEPESHTNFGRINGEFIFINEKAQGQISIDNDRLKIYDLNTNNTTAIYKRRLNSANSSN